MSTALTHKTTSEQWTGLHPSLPGASLLNWLRSSLAAYLAYRAFCRSEAQLMALDDRALKDIGLDRSEIGSVLVDDAHERRNGVRCSTSRWPPRHVRPRSEECSASAGDFFASYMR